VRRRGRSVRVAMARLAVIMHRKWASSSISQTGTENVRAALPPGGVSFEHELDDRSGQSDTPPASANGKSRAWDWTAEPSYPIMAREQCQTPNRGSLAGTPALERSQMNSCCHEKARHP
jgi:hypothetical protein